ncbi:hypothetical protein ABFS83_14G160700 [Erythranthe nasuta]
MNINEQIGVQCNNLGSFRISNSFFEFQSYYSTSSPPQDSCVHPQLPAIFEEQEEETRRRHQNVGPAILSDDHDYLYSYTPLKDPADNNNSPHREKIESGDTLQSIVQSCYCGNNLTVEKGVIQECKHRNNNATISNSCSMLSFNNNINAENCQLEKEQPQINFENGTTIKFGSIKVVVSGKEAISNKKKKSRIKWTKELDEKFIESVKCLGGARKATPKEILKLMKCNGLTIFHVKSHLQKYRFARLMPEATEGNAEQQQLDDSKTGEQIVEALRLQMDVQRSLYEQLESQKKLQMRIEEQAKQLQNMIKCQLNTTSE